MMWVFAIIIVLVLGAVAMVASGIGSPLPDVHPDRRDVLLPPGPLTPEDLRRVRFNVTVRGYRMAEVDALLARMAAELEQRPAAQELPSETETQAETEAGTQSEAQPETQARPEADAAARPEQEA